LSVAVVLHLSGTKVHMHNLQLLTLDELAAHLGRSAETIRKDLRRNPEAVPPRLQLPGTRLLRWRAVDVEDWLDRHTQEGARHG
jgi:predicted DNA-binding transcriptional regulator AlpA